LNKIIHLQQKIQPTMNDDTLFLPGLSPVGRHNIHARFDGGALSSDGGVLLLREIERGMNFSGMLASCLHDARDPGRTIHSHTTMIRERMFAIACGYEDCDNLDALRHDPAFRIACERLPDSGPALASQPTLSRLENTPSWRDLARMGLKLIDLFCASFKAVPGYIVLDIDDTPDRHMETSNCRCSIPTRAGIAFSLSTFMTPPPAGRCVFCCALASGLPAQKRRWFCAM